MCIHFPRRLAVDAKMPLPTKRLYFAAGAEEVDAVDRIRRLPFPTSPALEAALVTLGINRNPSTQDKATTTHGASPDNSRQIQTVRFNNLGAGSSHPTPDGTKRGVLVSPKRVLPPLHAEAAAVTSPTTLSQPTTSVQAPPHTPLLDAIGMLTCNKGDTGSSSIDCGSDYGAFVSSYLPASTTGQDDLRDRNRFEQLEAAGELPLLESIVNRIQVFVPTVGKQPPSATVFEGFHIARVVDNPFNPSALQAELTVVQRHTTATRPPSRERADDSLFYMCPDEGMLWVNTAKLSMLGPSNSYKGSENCIPHQLTSTLRPTRTSVSLPSKKATRPLQSEGSAAVPVPLAEMQPLLSALGVCREVGGPADSPPSSPRHVAHRIYRGGSLVQVTIPIYFRVVDLSRPKLDVTTTSSEQEGASQFAASKECKVFVELIFEEALTLPEDGTKLAPLHATPQRSSRTGVFNTSKSRDEGRAASPTHPSGSSPPAEGRPSVRGGKGLIASSATSEPSYNDIDPRTSFMARLLPSPLTFQFDQSDARWRRLSATLSSDAMQGLWVCYPLLMVRMGPWMRDVEESFALPAVDPTRLIDMLNVTVAQLEVVLGSCEGGAELSTFPRYLDAAALAGDAASILFQCSKHGSMNKPWDVSVCVTLLTLQVELLRHGCGDGAAPAEHSQRLASASVNLGHVLKVSGDFKGALVAYASARQVAKGIPTNPVVSSQLLSSLLLLEGEAAALCGDLQAARSHLEAASLHSEVVVGSMEPNTAGGLMARAQSAEIVDLLVLCGLQSAMVLEFGTGTVEDGAKSRVRLNQQLLSQLSTGGSASHAQKALRLFEMAPREERGVTNPRVLELRGTLRQGLLHKALALLLAGGFVGESGAQQRNLYHAQVVSTCSGLQQATGDTSDDVEGVLVSAQALLLQGVAYSQQAKYYSTQHRFARGDTRGRPQTLSRSGIESSKPGTAGGWSFSGSASNSPAHHPLSNLDYSDEDDVDLGWVEGGLGYAVVPPMAGASAGQELPFSQQVDRAAPPTSLPGTSHSQRNINTSESQRPQTSRIDFNELMASKSFSEAGEMVSSIEDGDHRLPPQLVALLTSPVALFTLFYSPQTTALLASKAGDLQDCRKEWWDQHSQLAIIKPAPSHPISLCTMMMAVTCEVVAGASPCGLLTAPLTAVSKAPQSRLLASNSDHPKPTGVPLCVPSTEAHLQVQSAEYARAALACGRVDVPSNSDTHPFSALVQEWAAVSNLMIGNVYEASRLLSSVTAGLESRKHAVELTSTKGVVLSASQFAPGTQAVALSPTKGGTAAERQRHREGLKQHCVLSLTAIPRLSYVATLCGSALVDAVTSNHPSVARRLVPPASPMIRLECLSGLRTSLEMLSKSLIEHGCVGALRWSPLPSDWPTADIILGALVSQSFICRHLLPPTQDDDGRLHRMAEDTIIQLQTAAELTDRTQLLEVLGAGLLVPTVELTDAKRAGRLKALRQEQLTVQSSSLQGGSIPSSTSTTVEALAFNGLRVACLKEAMVEFRSDSATNLDGLDEARLAYKRAVALFELLDEVANPATPDTLSEAARMGLCEALLGVARVEGKWVSQSRLDVVDLDRAAMAKQQASCGKPYASPRTPEDGMGQSSPHPLSTATFADISNKFTGTIPLSTRTQEADMATAARYAQWAGDVLQSSFGWGSLPPRPDGRRHLLVALLEARCDAVQQGIRAWCKAHGHAITFNGFVTPDAAFEEHLL